MEEKLYTVAIYSENQVGLLNQITIIFTRRGLNIESLSVSSSAVKGVHKFIMTTMTGADMIDKVVKQIEKRIDVLKAFYYTDQDIIYQEVALYKVSTHRLLENISIEELIRKFNAKILEVNLNYTVIEKTGHTDETQKLFEELEPFGVLQFVRSGRIAITRSTIEHLNNFLEEQELRRIQMAEI